MSLYFFNTDDGERVYRDEHGTDLPSTHAAVEEARKLAFDLFTGAPTIGRTIIACVVKDDAGAVVYRLMMDVSGEAEGTTDRRGARGHRSAAPPASSP